MTELKDLKKMVTTIMERFEHEVINEIYCCLIYVAVIKQEKAATLRRKREEQAQWEKDHTIVEDQ